MDIENVEALCQLFRDQPVAVVITEPGGKPYWSNSQAQELFGSGGAPSFNASQQAILRSTTSNFSTGEIQWNPAGGEPTAARFAVIQLNGFAFWTLAPAGDRQAADVPSAAIAAMAEGVVFQDANGAIVFCNRQAERILGLTREQMAGRTSMDPRWRSVHEDHSPFPGETHPAMVTLQTGRPLSDVVMGVHKQGGELTWIQINSCPLLGDDGKPTGVVTTFHDITEQKLLRDMLQTRDEQFARGFQSSPVIQTLAAVGSDGESRIVNVNEAFERQTGYRRYEAIGRTVRELGLWADGAALDAAVNEFRTKGSIDRRQFQLRTKHGEIREALTSVGTAEWDGRIYAVTNIVDLGDLQFSQPRDAAMRSLFENCSEPLLVFSMELHVVEANAAARELLGYGIEQLRQMPSGSLLEDAAGFPSGSRIRTAAGWPLQMEDRGVSTDAAGDPVQMVVLREIAAVH